MQASLDQLASKGVLPEPASKEFIQWLHKQFYSEAPEEFLKVQGRDESLLMVPGEYRTQPQHNVNDGRHKPPSSEVVRQGNSICPITLIKEPRYFLYI